MDKDTWKSVNFHKSFFNLYVYATFFLSEVFI